MKEEMNYDDQCSLHGFTADYWIKRSLNQDRVTKIRGGLGYQDYYTLTNPKLLRDKSSGFRIANPNFDVSGLRYFYLTLFSARLQHLMIRLEVVDYDQMKYGSEEELFRLSILGNIEFVSVHGDSVREGMRTITIKMRDYDDFPKVGGALFHSLRLKPQVERQTGYRISHMSDVPWSFYMHKTVEVKLAPAILTAPPLTTRSTKASVYGVWLGSAPQFNTERMEKDSDTTEEDTEVWTHNWDLSGAKEWADMYCECKLLDFLGWVEIPKLRSLLRNESLGKFGPHDIALLNSVLDCMRPHQSLFNAADAFAFEMFDATAAIMEAKELVGRCQLCGRLFAFHAGKKFCSDKSEGRDCGKSARNKRYYSRNRERIVPYNRSEMRETRKFMRDMFERKE